MGRNINSKAEINKNMKNIPQKYIKDNNDDKDRYKFVDNFDKKNYNLKDKLKTQNYFAYKNVQEIENTCENCCLIFENEEELGVHINEPMSEEEVFCHKFVMCV